MIHRDAFATVDSVVEYLELYASQIILFSFSGHAGRDHLLLNDRKANAIGIAGMLGRCPKLKVILLNGCSTAGQIQALAALPNRPVIIATKAPVGDFSAARFASSFFRALAENKASVEDAFEAGVQAAQTVAEHFIVTNRDIITIPEPGVEEKNLWTLFAAEPTALSWKLPQGTDEQMTRKQTIRWLTWWTSYLLIGLLGLGTWAFNVREEAFPQSIIPLFVFFAPFLPTLKTRLPGKRLQLLIGIHTILLLVILYDWFMEKGNFSFGRLATFAVYALLASLIYFLLLPKLSRTKY